VEKYVERKFAPPAVKAKRREYGYDGRRDRKVIVCWTWNDQAAAAARRHRVELWSIPCILDEIARAVEDEKTALGDDVLRTFQLLIRARLLTTGDRVNEVRQ